MSDAFSVPRFVAWGSYDRGKPRVRLLLAALGKRQVLAAQINVDIWKGIEDKSVVGWLKLAKSALRLVLGYPIALWRLLRRPRDEHVLLLYPAIIDIFVVWPLARLRSQTIVFDAFIPLYDTLVNDRDKVRGNGLAARLLWNIEKAGLLLADFILVDTDQHGDYFSDKFCLRRDKFITVPVGAEPAFWTSRLRASSSKIPNLPKQYVLFYGQFIPLHGISTIFSAALLARDASIHWLIIGSGQEEAKARSFITKHALPNLTWLRWVDYAALPDIIRNATVSLGIFGISGKASRVIPNKMYQILAAGGAIITRQSPAVAALALNFPNAIHLVPPGDARALADIVLKTCAQRRGDPVPLAARNFLSPDRGIETLMKKLME
ncbi:glycosyltransferase involved in cell wall biosynthesis [Sphingobium sp. B1D7B]|uniref:glycosyltransferase n=1 Tax=unclassified Sphingobium TaxID=2611147 RepID=UPI002225A662|nr:MULTISPECIES: glycosyltransferase [unclassified Sphingobium]MCW2392412.1 glycosyltransferase involved in cell wall biosynthesis [Sphingobium sp. B11D3A]MCW2404107.1 glycosyltransferase involved in cell wall biosynthesis [Sphingobium sp. B1D7B]